MTVAHRTNLQTRYRSTRLLNRLFITSVLVYMALAVFVQLASLNSLVSASEAAPLERVGNGIALFLGIGVIVGRRLFFRQARLRRLVEEKGLNWLVNELAVKTILLSTLAELIAVFGLVLSLLSRSVVPMIRFGLIGIVLLIYTMPRRSAWERTVENFSSTAYQES